MTWGRSVSFSLFFAFILSNLLVSLPFTKTTLLEIFFVAYGLLGIFIAIFSGNEVYVPILCIQVLGFIYISYLSITHSMFSTLKNRQISQIKEIVK